MIVMNKTLAIIEVEKYKLESLGKGQKYSRQA
jgi:hypothetical protein